MYQVQPRLGEPSTGRFARSCAQPACHYAAILSRAKARSPARGPARRCELGAEHILPAGNDDAHTASKEDKSSIRDSFAFYKEILCSDCGIGDGKVAIAKLEGCSHDSPSVERYSPAACTRNLGNQARERETAERSGLTFELCFLRS